MMPSCFLMIGKIIQGRERVSFFILLSCSLNKKNLEKNLTQSVCLRANIFPFSNALLKVFLLSSTPACDQRPSARFPSLTISSPRR